MVDSVRNIDSLQLDEMFEEYKKLRLDMLKLQAGTVCHADASTAIATADATNEATLVVLANALKASYNAHCASACSASSGQGVHIAADGANLVAAATATDTASAITLLNELKGDYNTHRASTSFHATADSTNAISAANATDEAEAITLANEAKGDLNAHYARAFANQAVEVVDP